MVTRQEDWDEKREDKGIPEGTRKEAVKKKTRAATVALASVA